MKEKLESWILEADIASMQAALEAGTTWRAYLESIWTR